MTHLRFKRAAVAVTLVAGALSGIAAHAQKLVVGGKNFTEQQILANNRHT